MKKFVLSTLFALGVGLAGATGATAATIGSGIGQATNATLIEQAALVCRRIEVCHRGRFGHSRCHWERVCHHVR
jgi:hypothetical protein